MKIKLPDLRAHNCLALSACGEVKSDDPNVIKYFKKQKQKWKYFRLRSGGKTIFASACIGESKKGGMHCHVDLATPAFMHKSEGITASTKSSDLLLLLSPLFGRSISIMVSCVFEIPINRLPPVIESTRKLHGSSGGVQIKMTRGTLAVTGAPIEKIEWGTLDDENVGIGLSARLKSTVSESYLADAFESMQNGFMAFIRGGEDLGTFATE
jgi:hypothetical protein